MTPQEITVVLLSLKVALVATLFCLPLAVALAFVLARKTFPGKALLSALTFVAAAAAASGDRLSVAGRLWAHRVHWSTTLTTGWALPSRSNGRVPPLRPPSWRCPSWCSPFAWLSNFPTPNLKRRRAILEPQPFSVFSPSPCLLAAPGVIAAGVLGFVKSLGEFGATITFVSNIPGETQTLALAIYSLLQTPNGDAAASRLIWLSIALAFAALLLADVFSRRMRRGRSISEI